MYGGHRRQNKYRKCICARYFDGTVDLPVRLLLGESFRNLCNQLNP
jgi:hypothetical protein